MKIAGYTELRRIHDGGQSVVYRAQRSTDGTPVVLKLLRGPYPTPIEQARFRAEYVLTKRLAGTGVVEVQGWADAEGLPIIVLEDFGAESLERLWPETPPGLTDALDVAIAVTEALARVHASRVLHLDISPSNVVRNTSTGLVKLIDFGLSTDLPRQSASLSADRVLRGTLRFVAPEQTGRLNRSIDYRTDLYSLGATLYWLFSGQPPFESDDALELVHAHIARRPAPIENVPAPVSKVVLKLLEKNAQDRYQSIGGLLADLRACRALSLGADVGAFEPGREDRSARFTIPEKLYGREAELTALFEAFDRVAGGLREVVLVRGSAGMGKTALVQELQRSIIGRRGVYVAGKFDQFKRSVPYAGLSAALRGFVRRILMQQGGDVDRWRQRLQEAVAPNGRLLTDLIPDLELLLGPQPEVPNLPPMETEARLHRTIRRFTRELSQREHPLVLFMDDLQWADLPSLSLLRVLATDARQGHLLLIGAFRDEEVVVGHPLQSFVHELTSAGVQVGDLSVDSLALTDVEQLVSDTVRRPLSDVADFARASAEKTGSNPFFLHRFLQSLAAAELVKFNPAAGWEWDLDAIRAVEVTDNVVGFLAGQLIELPQSSQRTLEAASIIGNIFGAPKLALALDLGIDEVVAALHEPLVQGLIEEVPHASEPHFRFLHDRIQQAAYEQSTPQVRGELHRHLGDQLLGETLHPESSDELFEIIDHLNAGEVAGDQVATLNFAAGARALAASAFAPALHYLLTARDLLGKQAWDQRPEMLRSIMQTAAHTASLLADYERMEALLDEAERHARDRFDIVRGQQIRIDALTMQNRTVEAVELGLEALRLLDIHLPSAPDEADIIAGLGATLERLEGVDLQRLPERAAPDDPASLLALQVLAAVAPPAYFINQALLPILGVELVRLTLECGPSPESSYGFALLGLVLCDIGQIEQGYAFGELAWTLSGRFDNKRMRVRAGHVVLGFTRHWREPAPDYMPAYAELCELAVDIGDFEYAAYSGMMHTILGFHMAPDLGVLAGSAALYTSMMQETSQVNGLAVHTMVHQAILNLVEGSADPVLLTGEIFDEPKMSALFRELGDATCLFVLYCVKGILAGVYGQWERSLELVDEANKFAQGAAGSIHKVGIAHWEAIAALEIAAVESDVHRKAQFVERGERALAALETWASFNPDAYSHRAQFIRAQVARVRGDHAAALTAFELAARMARQRDRNVDEAAALRAAGQMCIAAGWMTAARAYLIEARYAFERWGAAGVVEAFEKEYPGVVGNIAARNERGSVSTSTGTHELPNLDVVAVIRATQAITRELELDQLIRTVVRLSMEASGATRCVVVNSQRDGLHLSAIGISEPTINVSLAASPVTGSGEVPESVVQFVARTREEVLVVDATDAELTASDPFVRQHGVRSMLCLPVQQQGRLVAILYLEHRDAAGVFTAERVALLRVLLGQAAISAENAVLVETLEEQVRARTEQLAAASEAKSLFLRSMTHELRTPLNSILGYTQLLLDQCEDGPDQEALATIERSGRHLLSLINDVLDMNKIEAGKLDLVPERVELHGFVEGVARFFRPEAALRGLVLEAVTDPNLPRWIEADPRRLHQVMLNLLGNAVKFTDSGSVRVAARAVDEGMEVHVEDTGPGIPARRLAAIFEPFEQTGGSSQRARGTGLGLAIARQIARRMGGDLVVESELGTGSRFVFTVPLKSLNDPADAVFEHVAPESPPLAEAVVRPGGDVLARLVSLARTGDYSELVAHADELIIVDETLRPFAERLRSLARDFDDAGMAHLLGFA